MDRFWCHDYLLGNFLERRLLLSLLAIPIILYFYDGEIATRLWSIFQGHDTSADLRWALWDSTMYIVQKILCGDWVEYILLSISRI